MIYQWIKRNREHIGKHGVSQEEAQFVAEHARPPYPRAVEDGKMFVWGRTDEGRCLQVIYVFPNDDEVDFNSLLDLDRIRFEEGEDVGFVIHAMDMTDAQKRQYRRHDRR